MALSDEARNRLFIATTDLVIGNEIADAVDAGTGVNMTDLASTASGKGASLVGIQDSGAYFTSTTVEGALAETVTNLASTSASLGASLVGVQDSGGLFVAANVEAALAEAMKFIPIVVGDPGTGVAIPVVHSGNIAIVTAGAETNTLAIPSFKGQKLVLYMDTRVGGDRVVTASQAINQAGNTIMTFGAIRDTIVLEGVSVGGALRWQVTANDGVALS